MLAPGGPPWGPGAGREVSWGVIRGGEQAWGGRCFLGGGSWLRPRRGALGGAKPLPGVLKRGLRLRCVRPFWQILAPAPGSSFVTTPGPFEEKSSAPLVPPPAGVHDGAHPQNTGGRGVGGKLPPGLVGGRSPPSSEGGKKESWRGGRSASGGKNFPCGFPKKTLSGAPVGVFPENPPKGGGFCIPHPPPNTAY